MKEKSVLPMFGYSMKQISFLSGLIWNMKVVLFVLNYWILNSMEKKGGEFPLY